MSNRGLLTDREREILSGEADVSDDYRYRVVSRVRNKIDRIERDVEILADSRPDLLAEFREVVCVEADKSSESVCGGRQSDDES